MNLKEAETILKITKSHFEELGWTNLEIQVGLIYMVEAYKSLLNNPILPIHDKRFVEILRVLATVLEVVNSNIEKEKEKENGNV